MTTGRNNPALEPWPVFAEDEQAAVMGVLASGQVNAWTGSMVADFEAAFAMQVGCPFAVAVSNGTQALELALRALGLGEGDEVVVPARSFVATASAVLAVGAVPVFSDVDLISQNLTVELLQPLVNERTKAIIAVHLAGWPCDMEALVGFTEAAGLFLIEDCAQAHGAMWKGRSVGSLGTVGCWSFCQDKIISTGGEGGMLTTSDEQLFKRLWSLKDHGKDWDLVHQPVTEPGFRWLHNHLGTNARMTSIQAAIGLLQLQKLPLWQQARWNNMQFIWQAARECSALLVPCFPDSLAVHAGYKAYVRVCEDRLRPGWCRDAILHALVAAGVPCFTGACPEIYREALFVQRGVVPAERLPNAQQLGETSLMFLCHPGLSRASLEFVADRLQAVLREASL